MLFFFFVGGSFSGRCFNKKGIVLDKKLLMFFGCQPLKGAVQQPQTGKNLQFNEVTGAPIMEDCC